MSLFHVYNKFDSMDCVVVTAKNATEALVLAIRDGYLTDTLSVDRFSLAVFDLPTDYYIGKHERHVKRVA